MTTGLLLCEVARQVRRDTIRILEAADTESLTFAPDGTSNHLLWHAGHAMWLQDAICTRLLTGESALPEDWAETFGMNCRPVIETKSWPTQSELLSALRVQQDHLLSLLSATDDDQLAIVANPERGPSKVSDRIIHGLHDEAKHSGEMYLLLKVFRSQ